MAKLRVLSERPPNAHGKSEEQLADMRSYLYRVAEELEFVLGHLDERNFSPGLKIGAKIGDVLDLRNLNLTGGISGDGWSLTTDEDALVLQYGDTEIRLTDRVDGDFRRPTRFDFSTLSQDYFTVEWEGEHTSYYILTRDANDRITAITDAGDGFTTEVIWE